MRVKEPVILNHAAFQSGKSPRKEKAYPEESRRIEKSQNYGSVALEKTIPKSGGITVVTYIGLWISLVQ